MLSIVLWILIYIRLRRLNLIAYCFFFTSMSLFAGFLFIYQQYTPLIESAILAAPLAQVSEVLPFFWLDNAGRAIFTSSLDGIVSFSISGEMSGYFEMATATTLILLYPAVSLYRRAFYIAITLAVLFLANISRITIAILTMHHMYSGHAFGTYIVIRFLFMGLLVYILYLTLTKEHIKLQNIGKHVGRVGAHEH